VEEEGEGGVEGFRGWVREGEGEAVRWAYGRGCEIWLVVEVLYTYKFTQVVFLFSFTSYLRFWSCNRLHSIVSFSAIRLQKPRGISVLLLSLPGGGGRCSF